MLGLYTLRTHFFSYYCTKAILMRREHQKFAPRTTAVGLSLYRSFE